MRRFLILGATGDIGNQVVAQLAAKDLAVRAMMRNPAPGQLPPQVDDKPEIVTAAVAELTGSTARSFYQWSVDHAADFQ